VSVWLKIDVIPTILEINKHTCWQKHMTERDTNRYDWYQAAPDEPEILS